MDYDSLFQEYIRICNAALEANKDCYPYMRVLAEIEERLKTHPVRVAIYDEDDAHPKAFFELVTEEKRITAKTGHKPHATHPWLISREYLEEVARHPDAYITNPAQLNWMWLNDHTIG